MERRAYLLYMRSRSVFLAAFRIPWNFTKSALPMRPEMDRHIISGRITVEITDGHLESEHLRQLAANLTVAIRVNMAPLKQFLAPLLIDSKPAIGTSKKTHSRLQKPLLLAG